jgi:hypothetical protein
LATALSRFLCLTAYLAASHLLVAQGTTASAIQVPPSPTTPDHSYELKDFGSYFHSFNAALTASGVHDSANGWTNVLTPVVSYSLSQHYLFDASISVYPYHYATVQANATPPSYGNSLVFDGGDVGDVLLEGHAVFSTKHLRNTSTLAVTAPTGDRADGLGTGRATFNISNLTERYFGHTGLLVDIGGGNSSGLINRFVTQEDNSLGPLAQFQAGAETWLTHGVFAETVAYEQLPIGDQKTYGIYYLQGRPTTVVTGQRVSEDNGFNTSVFIPLSSHITLSSSYNRSLRFHLDTVSTGVTWVLRGTRRQSDSLIDRAMREAERETTTTPMVKK